MKKKFNFIPKMDFKQVFGDTAFRFSGIYLHDYFKAKNIKNIANYILKFIIPKRQKTKKAYFQNLTNPTLSLQEP